MASDSHRSGPLWVDSAKHEAPVFDACVLRPLAMAHVARTLSDPARRGQTNVDTDPTVRGIPQTFASRISSRGPTLPWHDGTWVDVGPLARWFALNPGKSLDDARAFVQSLPFDVQRLYPGYASPDAYRPDPDGRRPWYRAGSKTRDASAIGATSRDA
jgi:hypothetical protein